MVTAWNVPITLACMVLYVRKTFPPIMDQIQTVMRDGDMKKLGRGPARPSSAGPSVHADGHELDVQPETNVGPMDYIIFNVHKVHGTVDTIRVRVKAIYECRFIVDRMHNELYLNIKCD